LTAIMSNAQTGTVYLIGAGPGDPDLITVKGMQLLSDCDVVVYDYLVPDELIISLPSTVEKHYVGKKAGAHTLPQDEINALMVKLARKGKKIVRLKGSDPLIFGRGGEEAKYLKEQGIKFEIVPGVTSGIAGPAYAGIPCTDREKSSFVLFATGHKAADKEISTVPWEWVAQAKGGTLVIYMGVGEIKEIVQKLTEQGMSGKIPAAVIERGTLPTQRIITTTLSQLPGKAKSENVKPPALFIIGEVVELRKWVNWFKDKPLLGTRVMVTRAANQAHGLYQQLRDLGAEVLPRPTITTEEDNNPDAWERFQRIDHPQRWLVFTSENGVRFFLKRFLDINNDIRNLGDFKIAAIGEGTAQALHQYHITADFVPKQATVADLSRELTERIDLQDSIVVRVRGNLANQTLENTMAQKGVECLPLNVYRTYHPGWPDGFKEKLFDYPPDVILFTSGSTVDGLFTILAKDEVKTLTANAAIMSIGPSTSQTIRSYGLPVTLEAGTYSMQGLTDILLDYSKRLKQERLK